MVTKGFEPTMHAGACMHPSIGFLNPEKVREKIKKGKKKLVMKGFEPNMHTGACMHPP